MKLSDSENFCPICGAAGLEVNQLQSSGDRSTEIEFYCPHCYSYIRRTFDNSWNNVNAPYGLFNDLVGKHLMRRFVGK